MSQVRNGATVTAGTVERVLKRVKRDGFLVTLDFIIGRVLDTLPESPYRLLFRYDVLQRHKVVVSEVERLTAGERSLILDVGAGDQGIGPYIAKRDHDIFCLDVAYSSLLAAKLAGEKTILASGCHLPFADGAFDVVVSIHALEDIPDPEKHLFVNEIRRCSRKHVIILPPCGDQATRLAEKLLAWKPYQDSQLSRMTEEHIRCGVPLPNFLREHFPGCRLVWRSNAAVQQFYFSLLAIPVLRWLSGITYHVLLRRFDKMPPYVESLMSWSIAGGT